MHPQEWPWFTYGNVTSVHQPAYKSIVHWFHTVVRSCCRIVYFSHYRPGVTQHKVTMLAVHVLPTSRVCSDVIVNPCPASCISPPLLFAQVSCTLRVCSLMSTPTPRCDVITAALFLLDSLEMRLMRISVPYVYLRTRSTSTAQRWLNGDPKSGPHLPTIEFL